MSIQCLAYEHLILIMLTELEASDEDRSSLNAKQSAIEIAFQRLEKKERTGGGRCCTQT
jgi:hypothetical protein